MRMNKLEIIKTSSSKDLVVVLDFDKTLTCGEVDGVQVGSLAAILRVENFISEEYVAEAKQLFAHYHPIETDPHLDKETKSKAMQEWWQEHLELLTKWGLTIDDISKLVQSKFLKFRPGAKTFLSMLNDRGVRVILLSSGIPGYDGIKGVLEREGCNFTNVEIIANKLIWDEAGKAKGYVEPIIHSVNKTDFLTSGELAKNILLVGDNLHDADMVMDSPDRVVYRVGIYENKDETNLEHYKKVFDMVMVNEEIDFEKITNFLKN